MESIIFLLVFFACVVSVVKQSFNPWWLSLVWYVLLSAFLLYVGPIATEQSKVQFNAWIHDRHVMQDMAALVSIDAILLIAYVTMMLMSPSRRLRVIYGRGMLAVYPGLLVVPALFYLLIYTIFALPGVSFDAITYTFAGLPIVLWLVSIGVKRVAPLTDFRLEILLISSLFMTLCGLITTVDTSITYPPIAGSGNLWAWVAGIGVFVLLLLVGLLWYRYKWRVGGHRCSS